ncbi:uncharacterized protein LOC107459908 isoform X2 [Arachis duranensis]|uniref:DNA polymerase delta subunit 3 n=1 Tax=Arachis duranensis TaxID=130453 RepID=A0A6P5MLE6_ARADU|nr:uncharacterized protein LOC107459908 isoform X2 [Arachis duranensis]
MAQTQTLALVEEIESLVSDKLQVVSYKWLSRNYMISSNEAKRLLQEFVEKHDGGLEVVYALSGWLKGSHPSYHIRLVTGPKLAEAQQEFDGNCSIQVYSVQASIPKDPAVLWNAEFIQAEELFKQPWSVDNCLRDNRFCGISSSFVQRNVDGMPVVAATPLTKASVGIGQTKMNVLQPQKNIAHDTIPRADLKSEDVVKDVKSESNGTGSTGVHDQVNKPSEDKEKVVPAGKKKAQSDKSGSSTGGSLASFWGRASAKPKPSSVPVESSNTVSNHNDSNVSVATEDAQASAREADGSGDDDNQDVTVRRSSNRKRRVVFDLSDEDEDVVSLSSPELPKKQSSQDSKQKDNKSSEKATLNSDTKRENKPMAKEEKSSDKKANQPFQEELSVINKCTNNGKSSSEKPQSCAPDISVNKDSTKNAAPGSPKRRKVMKTRIDERGREVTEVVWEGEETEAKKADKVATKKSENNVSTNSVNSGPATKKTPAVANTTGKGSKKTVNKDPKQGNILSFFKRV